MINQYHNRVRKIGSYYYIDKELLLTQIESNKHIDIDYIEKNKYITYKLTRISYLRYIINLIINKCKGY